MNPRSTLWLGALALGLLAYIYFVEWRTPLSSGPSAAAVRLLPNLTPLKVTAVEIARSNQVIRAELVNDRWQLTNPSYPAQSTGIQAFLAALLDLTAQEEISAQEAISADGGLSQFGLDPPLTTIKLQEGADVLQLRVGTRTLMGNKVYVQPVRAPGIFIADAAFLEYLPTSAKQWRNPLLMPLGVPNFDHIAIASGTRSFKLERENTNRTWRLVEPMQARADFNQVQSLVRELSNARISQFVSDDPKEDLEGFGLQTPEAELVLGLGSNAVFRVQIGKSPTNDPKQVYARCLSHSNVVLVSANLATVCQQQYTAFRDHQLLSFRPSSIDRIEGHGTESFTLQRPPGKPWQIVQPFHAETDPQLMQDFLERLARLEVIRFEKDAVADFTPYGLVQPIREYLFQTTVTNAGVLTNQTVVQAAFGSSPTNEIDKVFCRRSDENSVYVVSREALSLPSAAFELRDRRLWSFDSSNVVGITVVQREAKKQFVRDPVTHTWVKDDAIMTAAIDDVLHRLGELQADFWWGKGEPAAKRFGTSPSNYQIYLDVNQNDDKHQLALAFGHVASSGQQIYAAIVLEEGQPVIFKFPALLFQDISHYLNIPPPASNQ
jgi:hypothetical protein